MLPLMEQELMVEVLLEVLHHGEIMDIDIMYNQQVELKPLEDLMDIVTLVMLDLPQDHLDKVEALVVLLVVKVLPEVVVSTVVEAANLLQVEEDQVILLTVH